MSDQNQIVLERMAAADSFAEAAKALVDWARELTDCEAAMLRFREGDEEGGTWIPALFEGGYKGRFLRDEILIGADECLCGSVCRGHAGDSRFFTEAGSFSSEGLQTITDSLDPASISGFRGSCILEGFQSVAIVPLGGGEKAPWQDSTREAGSGSGSSHGAAGPIGCLHLADRARGKFTAYLDTLESVCRSAGPLLGRFSFEERQQSLVTAIEIALAPAELPTIPDLDVSVSYTSATETAHLGGDFYDVIELGEGEILFLVGDYCGKGIAAAGMAARARSAIVSLVRKEQTPGELLTEAQEALRGTFPEGRFVTLAACRYSADGQLECASAGHPFPLALAEAGQVSELSLPNNLPLGSVLEPGLFREGEVSLDSDQMLVLYTDGITEARRDGRLFGVEGIAATWKKMAPCTVGELTAGLCESSAEFHSADLPDDDRLVLAARALVTRATGRKAAGEEENDSENEREPDLSQV